MVVEEMVGLVVVEKVVVLVVVEDVVDLVVVVVLSASDCRINIEAPFYLHFRPRSGRIQNF